MTRLAKCGSGVRILAWDGHYQSALQYPVALTFFIKKCSVQLRKIRVVFLVRIKYIQDDLQAMHHYVPFHGTFRSV